MSTSRQRLTYLFNCYYHKTATPQERDELFAIINAGKNDRVLSNLIRRAWDDLHIDVTLFNASQTDAMLGNILHADDTAAIRSTSSIFLWAKFAAAAVVLLFVGFGAYQYLQPDKPVTLKQVVKTRPRPLNDALPGGNKAVLTLANGQSIVLDNAGNGMLAKQGTTTVNKTREGKLIYNAGNITRADTPEAVNTIVTPRGGQYQVILADGTKVWLNSASSLRFPTRFTGNSRVVEVTGEAYFEVTKNQLMPFKVKTSRAEIEVLGTHFNVMAYKDESIMKTTLLEGAVNIKTGTTVNRLKPGQQARTGESGLTKIISNVDVNDETAWKNGIFQFRDAGVDLILRQASRWYNVDVTYKGKVPEREFTGRISRNVKASELLSMLKYTGIQLKIEDNKIIVF